MVIRSLALSLVLLIPVSSAMAVTWPGAAPCDTTLQACIDGVAAGSLVEVAVNTTVTENLTIDKSLTLQPAAGFSPTIDGYIILEGAAGATSITVQDLNIDGSVRAFPGAGAFDVHILGNTITNSGGLAQGIEVGSGGPHGDTTAEIRRNTVNVTGSEFSGCSGIRVGPMGDAGTTTAVIERNVINAIDCGQGEALSAMPGPGDAMTVDIIANRVDATGSNNGILVRNFQQTDGSVITARVINNTVTGQIDIAGFPAAIVASADGFEAMNVQIINNTVSGNDSGIGLSARTDLGATMTGLVANNISVNNADGFGIYIDEDIEGTVTNRNNLVFNNTSEEFTPGPGTITEDPRFVSETDFHLTQLSPAINAGDNAAVPGDITTDLDENPRIQRGVVDMGAYESALTPLQGADVPALDPLGLAALALVLGAAAIVALRR